LRAISLLVARPGEHGCSLCSLCTIEEEEEEEEEENLTLGLTTVTAVGVHVCLAIGA
jgi:hypothetical protein